jgi:hypothetical protein
MVSIPDELIIYFFNLPNPSNCTMVLGSTQLLTEISTRSFPGGIRRSARKVDKLSAMCKLSRKSWVLDVSQP